MYGQVGFKPPQQQQQQQQLQQKNPPIVCKCNRQCVLAKSQSVDNPNRWFIKCENFKTPSGCKFFKWVSGYNCEQLPSYIDASLYKEARPREWNDSQSDYSQTIAVRVSGQVRQDLSQWMASQAALGSSDRAEMAQAIVGIQRKIAEISQQLQYLKEQLNNAIGAMQQGVNEMIKKNQEQRRLAQPFMAKEPIPYADPPIKRMKMNNNFPKLN